MWCIVDEVDCEDDCLRVDFVYTSICNVWRWYVEGMELDEGSAKGK